VTDTQPVAALKRFISRTGFILLPTSVLFIKYFPNMGREFAANGVALNTGTTTNKNVFGLVILVIAIGTLWQIVSLVRMKTRAERRRPLIAQCVLLLFALVLFRMANSATSLACFLMGGSILVATNLRMFRKRPGWVQGLCLGIVSAFVLFFLISGSADIAGALGRDSNLSGRTDIWAALLPTVPNSTVGAGFESYWIGPGPAIAWETLARAGWWHPEILVTEAHNGYIELYLNLGWAGVGLIAIVIVTAFLRAIAAVRGNALVGSMALAYIMAAIFYDLTEAGFRSLNPMWLFVLLSIFTATAVKAGMMRQMGTPRAKGAATSSEGALGLCVSISHDESSSRSQRRVVAQEWTSETPARRRGKQGGF
jgi:O-antigen ligase